MTFRLTSLLAAFFARTLGRAKRDAKPAQAAPRSNSAPAPSWAAATTASNLPAYVIAAPLAADAAEWSIYNSRANRIVASGLSRNRAATLCETLNLASAERTHLPTDAGRRKGPPRRDG